MKKSDFTIKIAATAKEVWETMIDPVTYRKWVSQSWPGSYYEGNWGLGEEIRFIGDGQGGTLATIVEFRPYKFILARHIAVVNSDGSLDKDSAVAKNWIGTTESYTFTELDGETELKVEMIISPEWEKMINEGWPKALKEIKKLSELHTVINGN